ncbi:Holliday junction branch migration DNA helicase RuvB [Planctomycetota bacterium]
MQEESVFSTKADQTERNLEEGVRPGRFEDFIGQDQIKENLMIYIEAARQRGEVLDHLLLSGPPGLGKTTLSRIIAGEIGQGFHSTQGPALEKTGDLAGILTSLQDGDILFVDEIHRLRAPVEECLYSAMEDGILEVLIGEGPSARTLTMTLQPFTLIGATTREGLLSKPFRARFGVVEKLQAYPWEELAKIAARSARILDVELDKDAAEILARRSRGTPRLVNRFLRRVRDLAQVKGDGVISVSIATDGLHRLGIDKHGLDGIDRKILETLVKHDGRPVGLKTLAVVAGETEDTIEEVYEPYLIREGFIGKTPQGRVAYKKAFKVMGRQSGEESGSLF